MKSRCTFLEHLSSTLCVCVCVCVCLYRSVSLYPLSRICVRLTKVQCICAVVKVEYVQFE